MSEGARASSWWATLGAGVTVLLMASLCPGDPEAVTDVGVRLFVVAFQLGEGQVNIKVRNILVPFIFFSLLVISQSI